MASKLTSCPTCGNMVSENAKRCPHCGEKLKTPFKSFLIVCFWLAVIVFVIMYFTDQLPTSNSLFSTLSKEDFIARCETVDYKSVERYPDQYKGRLITFSGNVIQVVEGSPVLLRINQKNAYNFTWLATYTPGQGASRILVDDIVTVYGECKGVESYQSVSDEKITIPSVEICYYTIHN